MSVDATDNMLTFQQLSKLRIKWSKLHSIWEIWEIEFEGFAMLQGSFGLVGFSCEGAGAQLSSCVSLACGSLFSVKYGCHNQSDTGHHWRQAVLELPAATGITNSQRLHSPVSIIPLEHKV